MIGVLPWRGFVATCGARGRALSTELPDLILVVLACGGWWGTSSALKYPTLIMTFGTALEALRSVVAPSARSVRND